MKIFNLYHDVHTAAIIGMMNSAACRSSHSMNASRAAGHSGECAFHLLPPLPQVFHTLACSAYCTPPDRDFSHESAGRLFGLGARAVSARLPWASRRAFTACCSRMTLQARPCKGCALCGLRKARWRGRHGAQRSTPSRDYTPARAHGSHVCSFYPLGNPTCRVTQLSWHLDAIAVNSSVLSRARGRGPGG